MIKNVMDALYDGIWPVKQVQDITWPREIFKPYQYYIDRQIIITGKRGEIDQVVQMVNAQVESADEEKKKFLLKIKETPLARIDQTILELLSQKDKNYDSTRHWLSDLEIRLYDLVSNTSDQPAAEGDRLEMERKAAALSAARLGNESEAGVWAAIRMLHEAAAQLKVIVLADPNLIVGKPGSGGAGGISGGPIDLPVEAGLLPGGKDPFLSHWAFKPAYANGSFTRKGINLEKRVERSEEKNKHFTEWRFNDVDSKTTRVFVLDTADNHLISTRTIDLPGSESFPIHFLYLQPAVKFPVRLVTHPDISPHGRFVCGLLHRVAPEAEINLLQLLDDKGKGEMFTLTCALLLIAAYGMSEPFKGDGLPLSDTVINMSLSADIPEDRILFEGVRQAIDAHWKAINEEDEAGESVFKKSYQGHILSKLFEDIYLRFFYGPSLRIPIMILHSLGAVIVAAAGNESADRYGSMPTLVPARYPEVIAVGASNMQGKLSSFSNTAAVLAPGGGHEEEDYPDISLKALQKKVGDLEPYAICSVMPPTSAPVHLAYWWGTSFSAPLVSGLAALVIQTHQKVKKCAPEPEAVRKFIQEHLNQRVIDVDATLKAIK